MYKRSAQTMYLWPDLINGSSMRELPGTGDDVRRITDITSPSLTVCPAASDSIPAPVVLVFPGGGYNILAINKEGTEVAQWLNSIGVTAVILQYRVPDNRCGAFQDAQRAMGLIRFHSKEWNIDPARLGVMGFSAGGHLAARLSNDYETRRYSPVDEADSESCLPVFTILIYPGHLGNNANKLPKEIEVTAQTPPAFILQTQDDQSCNSNIAYYLALKKQNIPAELHLYSTGGHGYGLRSSTCPVSRWPELCSLWIQRMVHS